MTVPPILLSAAISLAAKQRPLLARRVLPGLPSRRRCERAGWYYEHGRAAFSHR